MNGNYDVDASSMGAMLGRSRTSKVNDAADMNDLLLASVHQLQSANTNATEQNVLYH